MHRILRQIVEVEVRGSERTGLEVQRQVSEVCQHAMRSLDGAFAAFDADERHLVIDRIDVDLGVVAVAELGSALTNALPAALVASLRGLREAADGAGSEPVPTPRAAVLSPTAALLSATLHFLRHGRLPWWYVPGDTRPLAERLLGELSPDNMARRAQGPEAGALRAFLDELRHDLRTGGRPRERLLLQFPEAVMLAMLAALDGALHRALVQALGAVDVPGAGGASGTATRVGLAAVLLETAMDELGSTSRQQESAVRADDLIDKAMARLADRTPAGAVARRVRAQPPRGDERGAVSAAVPARGPADPLARRTNGEPEEQGLFVERAGVVLLHPFLPRFFAALGVARGDAFVAPDRALLLVHHLASGALTAEEHELVFAKVLCGLPLDMPVAREAPVTSEEQAESTALLQAVVRHWEALRDSTPDGLRGNFLTRAGRLEPDRDGFVLRVERMSFDLLLDLLPWGISTVKLPWMQGLLRVEWSA